LEKRLEVMSELMWGMDRDSNTTAHLDSRHGGKGQCDKRNPTMEKGNPQTWLVHETLNNKDG
jgi:hypothetical protein